MTAEHRRITNDALLPEAWEALVRAWAQNLLHHVDGAIYVCMSTKEWPLVSRVLEELGGHWSDTIIWAKDRFVLGRADYQRQYEPIWYGWPEGASHHWCGDRDQGDVWTIPRPVDSELHPAIDPLSATAYDDSAGCGHHRQPLVGGFRPRSARRKGWRVDHTRGLALRSSGPVRARTEQSQLLATSPLPA